MERLNVEGLAVSITSVEENPRFGSPRICASSSERVLTGVPRKAGMVASREGSVLNKPLELSDAADSVSSSDDENLQHDPNWTLRDAGVQLDLNVLQPDENQQAPLELLTEFLSCVMKQKYKAARVLCNKILQLEPTNTSAAEFLPVIEERLSIDAHLSSEHGDSSDDDSNSVDSDQMDDEEHIPSSSEDSSQDNESEQSSARCSARNDF